MKTDIEVILNYRIEHTDLHDCEGVILCITDGATPKKQVTFLENRVPKLLNVLFNFNYIMILEDFLKLIIPGKRYTLILPWAILIKFRRELFFYVLMKNPNVKIISPLSFINNIYPNTYKIYFNTTLQSSFAFILTEIESNKKWYALGVL